MAAPAKFPCDKRQPGATLSDNAAAMTPNKRILLLCAVLIVGGILLRLGSPQRQDRAGPSAGKVDARSAADWERIRQQVANAEPAPPPPTTPKKPESAEGAREEPAAVTAAAELAALNAKEPPQDPLARMALFYVGLDPEAEEYWAEAINDPTLSPSERKDLIEDLNEEGFPDPKNLTVDDLPLILSRLALIEQHAPEAMDEVNAAAFLEAYNDLWKMYARVTQP